MDAVRDLRGRVALGTADLGIAREHRDRDRDVAFLRAAVDAGVTIVDTARAYALASDEASGERLVGDAIGDDPRVILIAKGGHWRTGEDTWTTSNTRDRLRRDAELSLRNLRRSRLDVFLVHRIDRPGPPIDEVLDVIEGLRNEGIADRVGLSNASPQQARRARERGLLDVVQNRFGLGRRHDEVLDLATEAGIPYFGYSPLRLPGGAALATALPRLTALATARGIGTGALVIAGLLASSSSVSVVSGATRIETLADAIAAAGVTWDAELRAALDADLAEAGADG